MMTEDQLRDLMLSDPAAKIRFTEAKRGPKTAPGGETLTARILALVSGAEIWTGDVAEAMQIDSAEASALLRSMEQRGLIASRKIGRLRKWWRA